MVDSKTLSRSTMSILHLWKDRTWTPKWTTFRRHQGKAPWARKAFPKCQMGCIRTKCKITLVTTEAITAWETNMAEWWLAVLTIIIKTRSFQDSFRRPLLDHHTLACLNQACLQYGREWCLQVWGWCQGHTVPPREWCPAKACLKVDQLLH